MNAIFSEIKERLQDRPVKIIGLGGVAGPLCQYISQFYYTLNCGASIYLIDGDEFEMANKERMLFNEYGKKALVKEAELKKHFGERVAFRALPVYVTEENIEQVISSGSLIFQCVDNHSTRKLVSEHCQKLKDVLLISGGNDGVENGKSGTFGNVQVFERRTGEDVTNPLTRFHPEIAEPEDHNPGDKKEESCAVLIHKIPQLAFTNLAVASAMLNTFYAWALGKLDYEEVYLDILQAKMVPVKRKVEENSGNV
jgi:molybdopterin/thiamine biosynthesis adenylyltransferase